MALLGVCGLFIGMRLGLSPAPVRRVNLPDVPAERHKWWLIRAIAACQVFVPFLPVGSGGDFRQVIAIVLVLFPWSLF
jgi:hypothetical protein